MPKWVPEAPKIVENGCQNRSKIDDQIRTRFLSFFQRNLGEKVGNFLCFFRCFFVCRALPNEKGALVKIFKKHMFFLGFFIVFLVDDRSESIENNGKDGCKSSQNRYLFDDTIFDSKMMKKSSQNRQKIDGK